MRLLREPEAAALSYALEQKKDERVMVFDLGGGTFDVSILDVGGGVVEVVATSGDPRLGGDDWDEAAAHWLEDRFVEAHGVPLDGFGRRRLRDAAEEAKLALSQVASVQVEVPFLHGERGLNVTLTRRKFEAICRPLVLRLVEPMLEASPSPTLSICETSPLPLTRFSAPPPHRSSPLLLTCSSPAFLTRTYHLPPEPSSTLLLSPSPLPLLHFPP